MNSKDFLDCTSCIQVSHVNCHLCFVLVQFGSFVRSFICLFVCLLYVLFVYVFVLLGLRLSEAMVRHLSPCREWCESIGNVPRMKTPLQGHPIAKASLEKSSFAELVVSCRASHQERGKDKNNYRKTFEDSKSGSFQSTFKRSQSHHPKEKPQKRQPDTVLRCQLPGLALRPPGGASAAATPGGLPRRRSRRSRFGLSGGVQREEWFGGERSVGLEG